jgi:hypothetical protein
MTSSTGVEDSQYFGGTGCYLLQNMCGTSVMPLYVDDMISDLIDVTSLWPM